MSKQSISLLTLKVAAAGTLIANRAVTAAGAHAATDLYGVTTTAGVLAEVVAVDVAGAVAIEAGAAIAAGTKYVIADAQGRAILGGTVDACLGKLVPGQSASAAGDFVQVVLSLTV